MKYKVLIVEDHASSSLGIRQTLNESSYSCEIQCEHSPDKALQVILSKEFDIVFLDIHFEETESDTLVDGDDLFRRLDQLESRPPVVVFSKINRIETLSYFIHDLGVEGYILKSRKSLDEIIPALEAILCNERFFSLQVVNLLKNHVSIIDLDRIDRMILKLLSQGVLQKDLCGRLNSIGVIMSLRGVEKRIFRLKFKFNAETLPQLIFEAVREGFLRLE